MRIVWGDSLWASHATHFQIGRFLLGKSAYYPGRWRVCDPHAHDYLTPSRGWVPIGSVLHETDLFPDRETALQALCDALTEEERKEVFGR